MIINQNVAKGLKVANGCEFTAVGVIPDPRYPFSSVENGVLLHFGPPAAIILKNKDTVDLRIPGAPPGTFLLQPGSWNITQMINRSLIRGKTNESVLGTITRHALPCTPSFAITNYKSQGQEYDKVTLGLYAPRLGRDKEPTKLEFESLYVQLSRAKTLDSIHLSRPVKRSDFLQPSRGAYLDTGLARLNEKSIRTAQECTAMFGNLP